MGLNDSEKQVIQLQIRSLQNEIQKLDNEMNKLETEKKEYVTMISQLRDAEHKVSRGNNSLRSGGSFLAKWYKSVESEKKISRIEKETENLSNIQKGMNKAIELAIQERDEREKKLQELKTLKFQNSMQIGRLQVRLITS